MFRYGTKSKRQLKTLHPWLQLILMKTLEFHDHSVDQGGRTAEEQLALYNHKPPRTTLKPPKGKHLLRWDPTEVVGVCSFAVDVTPWINGKRLVTSKTGFGPDQRAQFARFLGIVEQIGRDVLQGTEWRLRFGINWDEDEEILSDQKFQDWFHIEMKNG